VWIVFEPSQPALDHLVLRLEGVRRREKRVEGGWREEG
jgi:hypothetical protein